MRRIITWWAFIALIPVLAVGETDPYMDSAKAASLVNIQKLLLNDRFDVADSAISAFVRNNPNDPAGYLSRASLMMARMSDQEENLFPVEFPAELDTVEMLAKQADSGSSRNRAWMHLWLGHAKANGSVHASRFGSFTSAIGEGLAAKKEYEKGIDDDSTLSDLYFGLGSYHYWKSAKAGILRWLGIFHNDKSRGIAELKRAATSSEISREAAQSALIWIYFDCGLEDSAAAIVQQQALAYPEGKSFLWPLAKSLFDHERYAEAIEVFSTLRQRIASSPGNYYNLIECDYSITQANDHLGDKSAAGVASARLCEYVENLSKETRRRQQGKLGYLERKIAIELADQAASN